MDERREEARARVLWVDVVVLGADVLAKGLVRVELCKPSLSAVSLTHALGESLRQTSKIVAHLAERADVLVARVERDEFVRADKDERVEHVEAHRLVRRDGPWLADVYAAIQLPSAPWKQALRERERTHRTE